MFICLHHFNILFFEDGTVLNLTGSNVGRNEAISNGAEVWMEVDLRSRESEKRTLHWFVNGRTQKVFFKQLPSNVQFGVCSSNFSPLSSSSCFRLVGTLLVIPRKLSLSPSKKCVVLQLHPSQDQLRLSGSN